MSSCCNSCKYFMSGPPCSHAAYHGHLDCLKYEHENGRPWNEDICRYAAQNGNLDCLKYAHENGCSWSKGTCSSAAFGGNLDCLKYAHENGCPWDKCVYVMAIYSGHLNCIKYAHENGCPCDLDCKSTTWCEYRCDICWEQDCNEHDSAESFRKYAPVILYKDVVDAICSFI